MDLDTQTTDKTTVKATDLPNALELSSEELDSIAEPSQPFVGSWQSLISQTNWEKGKIVFEWRTNLKEAGVDNRLCSDPAWSRLVGEVTPQHVGRLRRTWERFGQVQQDYDRLYWSHFFAALDWDDAEMWLEGAVQNRWSVSKMRYQRWETMGQLKGQEPSDQEIVTGSGDEGVDQAAGAIASSLDQGDTVYKDDGSAIQGPLREAPDFGEEGEETNGGKDGDSAESSRSELSGDRIDLDAVLNDVPDDIARPFRQLRSAIQQARDDEWTDVKRIDVIALINDLKMLLRKLPKPQEESETS